MIGRITDLPQISCCGDVRLPMRTALECPNPVIGPPAQNRTHYTVQIFARQLPNVVERQAMPNVEHGVSAIESWQSLVGGVTLTCGCPVCCRRTTMPCGSFVDRMAVSVICVEKQ